MVAQLQQLKAEEILPRAMELIPTVRLAAGLPPLVTPTSQIVGAQAVSCALDEKAGRPMYTTKSSQFVALVKGEYGETPVKIDPEFRFKICGVREEIPYDTSKYQMQPNPELPEAGGVKLAANEKEVLLLELFPMVAKTFLTDQKKKAYEATAAKDTPKTAQGRSQSYHGPQGDRSPAGQGHRPEGESRRQGKSRTRSGYPRGDEDGKLDHQRRGGYDQADSRTGRR